MSGQWTEQDPGRGATHSLASLGAQLGATGELLTMGNSDINKALSVFSDDWAGLAADAARSQMESVKTRIGALSDAAVAAKKALNRYADEVEAIKSLAIIQISLRDDAQAQMKEISLNMLVLSPDHAADLTRLHALEIQLKAAQDTSAESVSSLKSLAGHRQRADEAVLEAIRVLVAEHWDFSPDAYPSDRSWEQQSGYEYDMDHTLGISTDQYMAQELMNLFKKYPTEIFPFTVKGPAGGFQDGAVFELSETLELGWSVETGRVAVTTTDTSVKFTVISDDYFDGPGSTIEFSVVEIDGEFYLRKVADAVTAQAAVAPFAKFGAGKTWSEQAENFQDVIAKYGAE